MLVDEAAEVASNQSLSAEYNVIALRAPRIARAARPGQFVMVKAQSGLDPMLRRPFSIFERLRGPDGDPIGISLLNKRVGVGTSLLYASRPGDIVGVLGPLGQPFLPVDPPAEAWMVAGGVGLAPFATLAEALVERRTPMRLFYGARAAHDLHYADHFARLGARLALTTEDGSAGARGRVTAPLEEALAEADPARTIAIYACGPTPMMRAVADLGVRYTRRVAVSLEPVMGCGMGGCYSCVVPTRRADGRQHFVRACLEGPVFDASLVVWDALRQGH